MPLSTVCSKAVGTICTGFSWGSLKVCTSCSCSNKSSNSYPADRAQALVDPLIPVTGSDVLSFCWQCLTTPVKVCKERNKHTKWKSASLLTMHSKQASSWLKSKHDSSKLPKDNNENTELQHYKREDKDSWLVQIWSSTVILDKKASFKNLFCND